MHSYQRLNLGIVRQYRRERDQFDPGPLRTNKSMAQTVRLNPSSQRGTVESVVYCSSGNGRATSESVAASFRCGISTQLARISPLLPHHHDAHILSLPLPTLPTATMRDDCGTNTGGITSNAINNASSSESNKKDAERLKLYRHLQKQLHHEQLAERSRRIDELVMKPRPSTLEDIAAMYDAIKADAQRPHELDDHVRWPTEAEMWAATTFTPPATTIAAVLALRPALPPKIEDRLFVLTRGLYAHIDTPATANIRAILRRAMTPINTTTTAATTTATAAKRVVPATRKVSPAMRRIMPAKARPTITKTPATPPVPSSSDSPEVATSLAPSDRLQVLENDGLRPLEPGEVRVARRRSTKRARKE
ncbi:hypothetical protein Q7P36_002592 [Cladosporium allicinum]